MNEQLTQQLLEETKKSNQLRRFQIAALVACTLVIAALVFVLSCFAQQAQEIGLTMQQMGETLSGFDFEALESSMQEMEDKMGQLDMDSLNDTLKKASETAGHLEKAAEGFEKFGQGFGNLFGR